MATESDVAEWMLKEVWSTKWLDQEHAVAEIERRFGSEFVYSNENGNPAISKTVLREFRTISADAVVWERSDRAWRLRIDRDGPRRLQD